MDRVFASVLHWDISIWCENNVDRGRISSLSHVRKSREDRFSRKSRRAVYRNDERSDIFASCISDLRRGGMRGYAGDIATLPNVTFGYLETEGWMLASDGLFDCIKAVERIVRDIQGQWGYRCRLGELGRIRSVHIAEQLYVWRWGDEVIHSFVKSGVGGSFDGVTSEVKVVEYLESSRVPEENAQS